MTSAQKRQIIRAARQVGNSSSSTLPPAFFLTDPDRTADILKTVSQLPSGFGVIYRHFGDKAAPTIGRALRHICHQGKLTLLVSADPKLAIEIKADGVHWPEARRAEAKYWRSRKWIMTTSSHSWRAVAAASYQGFSATLLSTVYPSQSPSASEPMGPVRFRLGKQRATLQVYALGGLTHENVGRVSAFAGVSLFEEA